MKSIRLNIRARRFDGATSLTPSARVIYNSATDSHDVVEQGGGSLARLGALSMRELVARGVIAATDHVYVSTAGHSGQAGVGSFVVRSCHVGLGRRISTSPTRQCDPSAGAGQVGPFALGPTDELVLSSDAAGEQVVTLELMIGTAVEVERLFDRERDAELVARTVAAHAASHQLGGVDRIDVTGLPGVLADEQNPSSHAGSHRSGGGDAIKLDDLAAPDDNTDLNASTSAHGLLPKLSGVVSEFLSGDGSWAVPSHGPAESFADTLAAGQTTGGHDIEISAGDSIVGEDGGSITFDSSSSGGGGGSTKGGSIAISGGAGGDPDGDGGDVILVSGEPAGAGTPGSVMIAGADAPSGHTVGGAVSITGGGGSGDGAGAAVTITSGAAESRSDAGDIVLQSGSVDEGEVGVVRIANTCLEINGAASVPGPNIGAGAGRFSVHDDGADATKPRFTDDTNATHVLAYDFGRSYHRVRGATSRGSSNTRIYIFVSVQEAAGSDISYTASSSQGSYWTIATDGIYAVSASVWSSVNSYQAINVAWTLSNTFNATHLRIVSRFSTGVTPVPVAWTGPISAGQVVWISTNTEGDPTSSNFNNCTVTRVR